MAGSNDAAADSTLDASLSLPTYPDGSPGRARTGPRSAPGARKQTPGTTAGNARTAEGENKRQGRGPHQRSVRRGNSALLVETVDTSGSPIPDLELKLSAGLVDVEAVTDDMGEASFTGIAAGTYTLHFLTAEGLELSSARPIQLAPGENKRITVRLGSHDLSIAGRVLGPDGAPLPGIAVEARRYLFQVDESQVIPSDQSRQSAVSDAGGLFEIHGLVEGEYEVSTVPTGLYPSAKTIVRAGVDSCELVLEEGRILRIYGQVTDPDGQLLADALVLPMGQPSGQTRSGRDGSYFVDFSISNRDRIYSLRFSLPGYRQLHLKVPDEKVSGASDCELDATLEPLGLTAPVMGVITAADNGDLVVGETVYLHSAALNARYVAGSDQSGSFLFPEVEVGENYRLWIHPQGDFKDFSRHPVAVPEEGLELAIELDPLGTGRILGLVVDSDGKTQPGFSLWLRSTNALGRWVPVTADNAGRFEVDGVPTGELLFDTRSLPRIRAQGVQLEPDSEVDVKLLVDWGDHELTGQITDSKREELVGAQVELHWTHAAKGIRSSSLRKSVTDDQGLFRFTQLGPGEHQLRVTLSGYKSYQSTHEVGKGRAELDIKLTPEKPGN